MENKINHTQSIPQEPKHFLITSPSQKINSASSKGIPNNISSSIKTTDLNEIIEDKNSFSDEPLNSSFTDKPEDIINYISFYLSSIIEKNRQIKKKQTGGPKEPLYGKKIPSLSIEKFLVRIRKYTDLENNTLILGLYYIEKILEKFNLGRNNVYRLLLGSCVIAIKFIEDNKYTNSEYCQIGGLSLDEFNSIEYNILKRLDFNVNASFEDIIKIREQINGFIFFSSEKSSGFYKKKDE